MPTNSPLIETVNPERWVGLSMNFIEAGHTALLVKNGQLVRILQPGRHFNFAIPLLEQCQLILVDTKIRNLEIVSHGDFLSQDQYVINISLNVMYQVADAKRVALELSDPIPSLTSAIKDSLGVAIGQMRVEQLTTQGRANIRKYILEHPEISYSLGFALEDVRVNDISFPQTRGVIRQVEGMTASQEAEHKAMLKAQIAQAGRPTIPAAPVQQVNIISGRNPQNNDPILEATLETPAIEGTPLTNVPTRDRQPLLAPTTLDPNLPIAIARLVNNSSAAIIPISTNPFTIGREPSNTLIVDDSLCSRNHARIIKQTDYQGTRYQLTDLGSSNGTYVDEQRLVPNQPLSLTPGNVIRIGSQQWTFED